MELIRFLATGFYSGLSPKAPGTLGSLLALVFCFLFKLCFPLSFDLYYILITFFIMLVGVPLCTYAEKHFFKEKDPGQIVIDEFAGMFIATIPIHLEVLNLRVLFNFFLAFFFFRFFDILKPPPIGFFEKLPGGWGIMADDIIAGLMAMILVFWTEGSLLQRVMNGI